MKLIAMLKIAEEKNDTVKKLNCLLYQMLNKQYLSFRKINLKVI